MGYFASLARQSGLRFRGEPAVVRSAAPLDVEETIRVEPSRDEPAAPRHRTRPAPPVNESLPAAAPRPRQAGAEPSSVMSRVGTAAVPPPAQVMPPPQAPTDRAAAPVTGSVPVHGAEPLPRLPEPAIADDRAVAIDAPPPPAAAARREAPVVRQMAAPARIAPAREGEEEPTRTVLLRQIQEWVAAGYQPSPAEVEKQDVAAEGSREMGVPPVIVFERDAPPPERTRRADARRAAAEAPPLVEEQHFELSIGTISVSVEGEDGSRPPARSAAPPQPAPSRQRPQPRQHSRLSRRYL